MGSIRLATPDDTAEILALYEEARSFMRRTGNRNQWVAGYPGPKEVGSDLARESLYVYVDDGGALQAALFFCPGPDPTYDHIAGAWTDDGPYHVVHRIAAREGTGAGKACLRWAQGQARSLRIDTHEDNAPMRHVLCGLGFTECGTIWLSDGSPRVAYQYVRGLGRQPTPHA